MTDNTTMIERVARALCKADGFIWDNLNDPMKSPNGGSDDQEYYQDQAKAAIEAIIYGIAVDNAVLVTAQHMDVFGLISNRTKFPPNPSTATWSEYSKVEQAAARVATIEIIKAALEEKE